ncbi:MAG: LacI family DNA-binding transcriptional regulator, partial [Caldisericum exile]
VYGKTKKVGVIITTVLNPFYAAVVSGIERVLTANGYTLILYNSNEDPRKEREALLILRQQRVDGIIFAPIEYESQNVKYLIDSKIPFVLVARRTLEEDTSFVIADDFKVGKIGTEHLIEKGHRRILFLNSWKNSSAKFRLEGYKSALREAGFLINPKLIYSIKPDTDLKKLISEIFSSKSRPTAIFCFCDSIALEVMKVVKEEGLKIPDDVAILGCDNLDYTELLNPSLTTIDISKFDMGVLAARILLGLLEDNKEPVRYIFEPKLVIREST